MQPMSKRVVTVTSSLPCAELLDTAETNVLAYMQPALHREIYLTTPLEKRRSQVAGITSGSGTALHHAKDTIPVDADVFE